MIYVDNFKGTIPKVESKNLPNNFAQISQNCDLRSGTIKPMKGLTQIQSIAKTGAIRTIYKIDDTWIYWTAIVEVVKAQVASGNFRILYTGDSYPKQTDKTLALSGAASSYPTESRRLGVIAPTVALTLEPQAVAGDTVVDSVSYVYTYVTAWGEESAPSPATVVQDIYNDQYVRLKGFVIPVLATTGNDVEYFRLYRLASGTTGAEYQMVKARPAAYSATAVYDIPVTDVPTAGTYVYDCDSASSPDALNDDLSDDLPSQDWDCASATLEDLVQFQNGIVAGIDADELNVSEPMIYYAMPEDYKQTIPDMVALGVCNEALIVTTNDFPYIIIGSDPASLMSRILPYNQANLSKRGTVSTRLGVIYPSPDGLFAVNQAEGNLLTKNIYKKEQWDDLTPESLISFYYDDKYLGFISGTNEGIKFNFQDEPYIETISAEASIYGGHIVPEDDTLYLLTKAAGTYNIKSFETGSNATRSWKSKVFEEPYPDNYAWGRVSGDYDSNASAIFTLYADGVSKLAKTVTDNDFFRLPSGYMARRWEFGISGGAAEVTSVFIGHTKEEAP